MVGESDRVEPGADPKDMFGSLVVELVDPPGKLEPSGSPLCRACRCRHHVWTEMI